MIPSCSINPKTGKPFSKHKYRQSVYITSYVGSFHGGMKPGSYSIEGTCERCGFHKHLGNY